MAISSKTRLQMVATASNNPNNSGEGKSWMTIGFINSGFIQITQNKQGK